MIRRRLASIVLASALILTVFSGNITFAAESKAKVTFTEPTDAPELLNPDNPSEPATEDQTGGEAGNTTGQTGPLTLDFVSHLDFGSHPVSVSEKTYEATKTAHIQVTDRRGAQATGWNVTLQASRFMSEGKETLEGAKLSFENGEVKSNLSGINSPNTSNFTVITGGEAQRVTNAAAGTGVGTWLTVWNQGNVKLTVLQNTATKGEHVSTLTWTLTDAPGQ